jgi:hypothetical protein
LHCGLVDLALDVGSSSRLDTGIVEDRRLKQVSKKCLCDRRTYEPPLMSHVPCTESDMVWLVDDDKPQQNHHNSGYRCRWRSHGLLFVSSLRRDMDPSLGFVCRVHRDMDSTYSPLCGVHSIYRISSSRFVAYTRFVRLSFQCLLYLQSSSGSGLLGRSGGSSFPVCIVAMVLCSWIRATTFRTGLSTREFMI